LPFDLSISEVVRRAEERTDALEAKLKISEKAREKAEKDDAVVEGLRQRLKTAEDTLRDKEAQQIEHENAIVTRFETQNRKFTSKPLLYLPFSSAFVCLSPMLTNS
jgi:flagellar motility protein MotE (MotC chaperone)